MPAVDLGTLRWPGGFEGVGLAPKNETRPLFEAAEVNKEELSLRRVPFDDDLLSHSANREFGAIWDEFGREFTFFRTFLSRDF